MPPGLAHCHVRVGCRVLAPDSPQPPVGAADADGLLMFASHAEFSRGEQSVHNVIVLPHAIIDELTIPLRPDDEQWRRLSLRNPAGHLDVDFGPVVERGDRTPGRVVAFNGVAEPQSSDIDALNNWRGSLGTRVLT